MYYVTMIDRFMSGWGAAAGKINRMVVECQTMPQAEQIARVARARSEMRRVRVCLNRPRYGAGVLTSWKTWDDMGGSWKQ
jgi:hypothetical protein